MIKFDNGVLYQGDCLEVMKNIPDNSVDMILCDLPYGTTQNKWDSIIDFNKLWEQYNRIKKINTAIVLTAQPPFDKALGYSNINFLKYEWIWKKTLATGHLNSKKQPLKIHENILVFYDKQPIYNPQFTQGKPYKTKSGKASSNYGQQIRVETINTGNRYPISVLEYSRDKNNSHSTQKPVELFEYLIKTYSNEDMMVLDNCIGSGTTAVAAQNTNRKFIGIELDDEYYNIAAKRILENQNRLKTNIERLLY